MTQHDTPEAVEHKVSILDTMALYNFGEGSAGREILNEIAAMFRRLHQRAVGAERHLVEQSRAGNALLLRYKAERDAARAALVFERADALLEAAAAMRPMLRDMISRGHAHDTIIALITQEQNHAE